MITIPLRILLVEDNEADIFLITRVLKKLVKDPEIEVVQDLESCQDRMINFIPDVVISDYNLPTCNGLEIMQLVQEREKDLPFIFVTGTVDDEALAENTVLAGAWGYVLKKDMNQLEQKLRPLLKKVVFHLGTVHELRERLRKNKISVNQIYSYLDTLKEANGSQQQEIARIKEVVRSSKSEKANDSEI